MHEETISPVDALSRVDLPSDIFTLLLGGAVNWLLSDNARGWFEKRCARWNRLHVGICWKMLLGARRLKYHHESVIRSITGILRPMGSAPVRRRFWLFFRNQALLRETPLRSFIMKSNGIKNTATRVQRRDVSCISNFNSWEISRRGFRILSPQILFQLRDLGRVFARTISRELERKRVS